MKGYFIWVDGNAVPVSEEVFRAHKHFQNKEEYAERKKLSGQELSLDMLLEAGVTHECFPESFVESAEDIAIHSLLIEQMREAMDQLPQEDKHLICQIFLEDISLREISRRSNIPVMTLQNRKNRVLADLRWLMDSKKVPYTKPVHSGNK